MDGDQTSAWAERLELEAPLGTVADAALKRRRERERRRARRRAISEEQNKAYEIEKNLLAGKLDEFLGDCDCGNE